MLTILSLGAGVQSTTLALMAARREIGPMPDAAIFADTGAEPAHVYRHLEWLETQLPFPVHRVMRGEGLTASIIASTRAEGARAAGAPFYTSAVVQNTYTNDADDVIVIPGRREGLLRRQCTREFKVEPITAKVRELLGLAKGARAGSEVLAEQWIGISWDERERQKLPKEKWLRHRWPLIELGLTRGQCLAWMEERQYPKPGKSACSYCPYHTNEEWRDLKTNHPDAFAEAVRIDEAIRSGVRGTTQELYVHRSLTPLAEADLSDPAERQISMLDECDGMCGV